LPAALGKWPKETVWASGFKKTQYSCAFQVEGTVIRLLSAIIANGRRCDIHTVSPEKNARIIPASSTVQFASNKMGNRKKFCGTLSGRRYGATSSR
jgi:hypothetical protein